MKDYQETLLRQSVSFFRRKENMTNATMYIKFKEGKSEIKVAFGISWEAGRFFWSVALVVQKAGRIITRKEYSEDLSKICNNILSDLLDGVGSQGQDFVVEHISSCNKFRPLTLVESSLFHA